MNEKKTYSHHRSDGQKQISISLPVDIVRKATVMAHKQKRSRSAMICLMLELEIFDYERKNGPILLKVAEDSPEYGKKKPDEHN